MFTADLFKIANNGNRQIHQVNSEINCGTSYHGVQLGNKREQSSDTSNNLHELLAIKLSEKLQSQYPVWSHLYNVLETHSLFYN